jgi:hypothetical protein
MALCTLAAPAEHEFRLSEEARMKVKRFSEEQIIGVVKEADAGVSTKELCRRHRVSGRRRPDAPLVRQKSS